MTREFEKELVKEVKKVVAEIQDLEEAFVEASVARAVNRLRNKTEENILINDDKVVGKKMIVATKMFNERYVEYKGHPKCTKYNMVALVMIVSENSYKWAIEECDYYWDGDPQNELEEFVDAKYNLADMAIIPDGLMIVV